MAGVLRPILRPVRPLRPLTRAITEAGVGGGPSAFSAAKAAILADAGDVNILVIGDSTSNETSEWAYLFAAGLASIYPTHSVNYIAWNDAGPAYSAPTSISTGSGLNAINVYSASVAGSQPNYLMGAKFADAIVAPDPDFVLWNHGHNVVGIAAAGLPVVRGEFLAAMEMVRLALPGVAHAAMRQNPRRDDNQMAAIVAELDAVAALYGDVTLIDGYARFIAAGKPSGWYVDNIHPNATGSAELAAEAMAVWNRAAVGNAPAVASAFLSETAANLLSNAEFGESYAGGTPAGWTVVGTPTGTVENTIVDSPHTQSLQIDNTAAGSGYYFPQASLNGVKGGLVTLAVRAFIPDGAAATVGRIAIYQTNGSVSLTTTTSGNSVGLGGWRWLVLPGVAIPADATLVRAYIYGNTAASAGSTIYYDRAILVAGNVPRDAA